MLGFHDVIVAGIIGLIGTVCVAMISGIFSIIGLIISKEQKLSDFRQAWIDALRDDISHFVSYPIMISAYNELVLKPKLDRISKKLVPAENGSQENEAVEQKRDQVLSAFYADMREEFSRINIYSTRIKLRLNDDAHETDPRALLSVLGRLEGFFSDIRTLDDKAVHEAVSEIEAISRPLLKKEWERVKKGERTFRVAKYSSLAASCLLAVAILWLFLSVPAYLVGYAAAERNSQHTQTCPAASLPSAAK